MEIESWKTSLTGVSWLSGSTTVTLSPFVERVFATFYNCVKMGTKAWWLSLKVLRKQDYFRWKLYENRMTLIESYTKAGWHLLKVPRKLYKSRMTLVESSVKAGSGWLLLKALTRPFKKHVNCDNSKFRDKIAYVGGPSWPWPWPFGQHCYPQLLPPCGKQGKSLINFTLIWIWA